MISKVNQMYRMHDDTAFGTTVLSSYASSNANLVLSTSTCSTTTWPDHWQPKVLPQNPHDDKKGWPHEVWQKLDYTAMERNQR